VLEEDPEHKEDEETPSPHKHEEDTETRSPTSHLLRQDDALQPSSTVWRPTDNDPAQLDPWQAA